MLKKFNYVLKILKKKKKLKQLDERKQTYITKTKNVIVNKCSVVK